MVESDNQIESQNSDFRDKKKKKKKRFVNSVSIQVSSEDILDKMTVC